jgi:hypothetical protein
LASLKTEGLFNEVHIDVIAYTHAVLECSLVIAFSSLRLDVLLDSIDLGFVTNQLLFDVIKSVVDVTLKDLILLGIMLHRVVSHLL